MNPLGLHYRGLVVLKMRRDFEKARLFGDAPIDDPMDATLQCWINEARTDAASRPYARKKAKGMVA